MDKLGNILPAVLRRQPGGGRLLGTQVATAFRTVIGPEPARLCDAIERQGFVVVDLRASLDLSRAVSVFVKVSNLLDARYATFAQFGNPTGVGALGIPAGATVGSPGVNTRFEAPAAPIAVYGGVRIRF